MIWHSVDIIFIDYRSSCHGPDCEPTKKFLKNNLTTNPSTVGVDTRATLHKIMFAPVYASQQLLWCKENIHEFEWFWDVKEKCEEIHSLYDACLSFRFLDKNSAVLFKLMFYKN